MSIERRLAADPVVAAAIAAHGVDPEDHWIHRDGGERLSLAGHQSAPRVTIRDGCAMVKWWRPGTGAVHYEATDPGGTPPTITMNEMEMADSLAAALAGRPLRDLLEIAGDPGFVIREAGTASLGEFRHVWVQLAPPADRS